MNSSSSETKRKSFHEFFTESEGLAAGLGRKDIFKGMDEFYSYLSEAMDSKQYAYRRTLCAGTSAHTHIIDHDGIKKEVIMMGSNNYLDFANDPEVKAASINALEKYGYGSGSVALLGGTFEIHRQLENQIADFYTRDRAAVFPTGFSANVGTISALVKEGDLIMVDMYAHASLVDGTKLTQATVKFFKHNDMEHLSKQLERLRDKFNGCLIVTDGVFSMDGDLCHLPELIKIKEKYQARLLIDEAHGVGIVGKNGRGTEEHFNLVGQVDIITGTLSKAPAGLGGYVVGSAPMVEKVRHFASSYIFSTSLPPSVIGGLCKVFEKMKNDPSRMHKLHENIAYFAGKLRQLGFNLGESSTAIVPVIIGDEELTMTMAKELTSQNIFTSAVIFPAVSKTQSRLRISLMSSHSKDDLDRVLMPLEKMGRQYGVIK